MTDALMNRRARTATAFEQAQANDTLVLIGAGEPIPVPGGLDRVYPYLAHPHYAWLTEQECPGAVLAWDAQTGWAHFAPSVSAEQRIWDGDVEWDGEPLSQLGAWLAARRGRPLAMLGVPLPGISSNAANTAELDLALLHARRSKDTLEIDRIRLAAEFTAEGHKAARELIASRPQITERDIAVELECAFRKAGADGTGYDSIVGSGPNAAVFHGSPGSRQVKPGETVLIDAGAEANRYTADVTRVYCGPTGYTGLQRELIGLVTEVERSGIAACRPGTEFLDLHRNATVQLLEGLVGMDVVSGDPEDLAEQGVGGLFFPHGLGHLVGMGVRDATGAQPGRPHRIGVGGVRVRLDARLEPNWVVTIEPGCYFIPGLLDNQATRDRFAGTINFGLTEKIRKEISGVRIEDDILITEQGPESLTTAIPHFDQ